MTNASPALPPEVAADLARFAAERKTGKVMVTYLAGEITGWHLEEYKRPAVADAKR